MLNMPPIDRGYLKGWRVLGRIAAADFCLRDHALDVAISHIIQMIGRTTEICWNR